MTKTIAIIQSSYIPWKGYFDLIAAVDEFVIFDDVQFTRRDWRSRNRIILNGEARWLTVPVASKGNFEAPINRIRIADPRWAKGHWQTLRHAYGKTPHFATQAPRMETAYAAAGSLDLLSEVNCTLLRSICAVLKIETPFASSENVEHRAASPTDRLIEICRARGATAYVSGPAARAYIETPKFQDAGIALYYANYSGYPDYDQGARTFEHGVSMLDLIFRLGPQAREHLKSVRSRKSFLDPQ